MPASEPAARLIVVTGDITLQDTDAIVNAANGALKRGGGVDGAIHRAAGPELQLALDRFGGCPTGDCRVTPGFRLRARAIIHCVGPVWRGGAAGEAELLASCYQRALEAAAREGFRSVAFPAISTGIYGYPPEEAAGVAVAAVRRALAGSTVATGVSEVRFVCFDAATAALYRACLSTA
ncbi:MAG: macro domain-containing protein [Rhodospirillaceae bacterium]